MKFKLFVFVAIATASSAMTQEIYKPGAFVIKGKIKNAKNDLLDYLTTGYFKIGTGSIPIKTDGSFEAIIPIQYRQDISINSTDEANENDISFLAKDGDTIELSWDEAAFQKSFLIKGKNTFRTKELSFHTQLHFLLSQAHYNIQDTLYTMLGGRPYSVLRNQSDSNWKEQLMVELAAVDLANEAYNKAVKTVFHLADSLYFGYSESQTLTNQIAAFYFRYCSELQRYNLIPKYNLWLSAANVENGQKRPNVFSRFNQPPKYTYLNEGWLQDVPGYRDFLYRYIKFPSLFMGWESRSGSAEPYNSTLHKFKAAQANLIVPSIRDWFIVGLLMNDFRQQNFAEVELVYQQALPNINNVYLKNELEQYYMAANRLKPGNPAPDFTLENEKGQRVSLSNFKGKVVYLGFWGVYCSPCLRDFKTFYPQIQEHYKNKEVVFINVCVNSKKDEWMAALKKYKPGGINLFAEGLESHPVPRSYNVFAVPHHVLIDKEGRLVHNNVIQEILPMMINLKSGTNAIDLLFK